MQTVSLIFIQRLELTLEYVSIGKNNQTRKNDGF